MRGDLHTLKRVCEYASKVMLVAEFVLAAIIVATVVLAVAALFTEDAESFLLDLISASDSDSMLRKVSSVLKFLMIWILGFVTVKAVHDVMCTIRDEHSPFTNVNTDRMIATSLVYLGAAFIFLLLDILIATRPAEAVFLFLGLTLVSVVLYCLALVCRYGAVLQKESDETL
jgi:hypothetical protein